MDVQKENKRPIELDYMANTLTRKRCRYGNSGETGYHSNGGLSGNTDSTGLCGNTGTPITDGANPQQGRLAQTKRTTRLPNDEKYGEEFCQRTLSRSDAPQQLRAHYRTNGKLMIQLTGWNLL